MYDQNNPLFPSSIQNECQIHAVLGCTLWQRIPDATEWRKQKQTDTADKPLKGHNHLHSKTFKEYSCPYYIDNNIQISTQSKYTQKTLQYERC